MTLATEAKTKVDTDTSKFSMIKSVFKGILLGVVVVCIALIVAVLAAPRVIGAVPLTVLTGSMVPTFNPGDLIVTIPVEDAKAEIKRGDIITFQPESGVSTLVTHRVSGVGFTLGGNTVFTTKGDANDSVDEPIIDEQVMGKYLYHVPYVGHLTNAIPNDTKPIVIQLLGASVLAWAFIQFLFIVFTPIANRRKKSK